MPLNFDPDAGPLVLGMVHLPPLPGTPFYRQRSLDEIRKTALAEALALKEGGATGCLIQTMDRVSDTADSCDPARLAAMTLTVGEIVAACGPGFAVGVQFMKNAVSASLAVAKVTGAQFIRVSAWIGGTASAFGIVRADPLNYCRYRDSIGADDVTVIADIHSQHFRWLDGEMPLQRVAHWAVEAEANALCLGEADREVTAGLVQAVRQTCPKTPIILPGYTSPLNAGAMLSLAQGAFVGGCLKDPSTGRVAAHRVRAYMEAAREAKRHD